MKRIVGMVLIFVLLTSLVGMAFADNQVSKQYVSSAKDPKVSIKNEYLELKKISSKTETELLELGYSSADILKIKNITEVYSSELKRRSQLSDEELQNMGYNQKQIDLLRSFTGSEEEIIALAATLTLSAYTESYWYNGYRTYMKVRYSWTWSSPPLIRLIDIIGFAWSRNFIMETGSSYTYCRAKYKTADGLYSKEENYSVVRDLGSAKVTFPIEILDTSGRHYWNYYGTGAITISKTANEPENDMAIEYGHTIISVIPDISVGANLDIVFKPTVSVNGLARKYIVGRI